MQKNLKILLVILLLVFITAGLSYFFIIFKAFEGYKNNKTYSEEKGSLIGGDKDEGGCLIAAGYSWCEIKQKCLRIWEEPCLEDSARIKVENYLTENISELSPEKEVLGGKFYITSFRFIDDQEVVIDYEDGHIALQASVIFSLENNEVAVHKFSMLPGESPTLGNDNMLAPELARLLAEKHDKKPEDVTVTIEKQTEFFIKGRVKFAPEDQPGNAGIFFATQAEGEWQIVFDGNGLPSCSETDRYGFPADMLAGCLNESGELRKNDWEAIKRAILNCQVKEVMQTHSQYVSATLKDGIRLEGVEPVIDDIIDLAISVQGKCGEILMATE